MKVRSTGGTEAYPEAVVDSRTITTPGRPPAPLAVQVIAPSSAKAGDRCYEIVVNNYRIHIGLSISRFRKGRKLINITPPISTQADPRKRLTWTVENIMPNSSYSVDLYLKKEFGVNVPLRPAAQLRADRNADQRDRPIRTRRIRRQAADLKRESCGRPNL